jgi:hypothetical protein
VKRSLSPWGQVCGAHAVAILIFTWPLALSPASAIWGDRFDAWSTLWLIDHLGQNLTSLSLSTDALLFPLGYDLRGFGHVGLQLLGAPLVALGLPVVLVFNGLLFLSFFATSLATHALGLRLGRSHWAGLLAAGLFVYSPMFFGEMRAGCIELVSCWFLPLQALLLLRLCDEPGWGRAKWVALNLGSTALFNWYYTLFTGMFTVAFALWRAVQGGSNRNRTLGWIGAAVALAAVSNLPLVSAIRRQAPPRPPISAEQFSESNWAEAYRLTNGEAPLSELTTEALALQEALQVPINSTSLANFIQAGFGPNPLESTPGALALAFGLFGLIAAGRRSTGWACIGGFFALLTLGPFLQVDATPPIPAWSIPWPLPYLHLYNDLPFFSMAYRPYRLGVVVVLCLAAMAALGLSRMSPRAARWIGLAGFLAAASQPHWHREIGLLASTEIPSGYDELRDLPEGAVLELPLHYQPLSTANARVQYFQVAHGKPLVNCNELLLTGDLARFRDHVQGNGFLQVALDLGRAEPPFEFTGADLLDLREEGVRWVVFHKRFQGADPRVEGDSGGANRPAAAAMTMLRTALGSPRIESEDLLVFEIPDDVVASKQFHITDDGLLPIPLAAAAVSLPVFITESGLSLPAEKGTVRGFTTWARAPEDTTLTLVADHSDAIEIQLSSRQWTWIETAFSPAPALGWSLETEGTARVELDRPAFLRGGLR